MIKFLIDKALGKKSEKEEKSETNEDNEDWINFITTFVSSILLASKNYPADDLDDEEWVNQKSHNLTQRIIACFLQASNKQYANPFAYLLATEIRQNSLSKLAI